MGKTTLIRHIQTLYGCHRSPARLARGASMQELPFLRDAFVLIENERIADWGEMRHCPERADIEYDARGRLVLPAWCDSHTHLVFATTREEEFVDKLRGVSYEEIAAKGGGILNSARRVAQASESELYEGLEQRLAEVFKMGSGAVEIKSGYGLSLESELKMLRVIRRAKESHRIPIRATFLGAHALPLEYRQNRAGYLDLVVNEMLPQIAHEGLADFCDVFCETGFFTPEDTERVLNAALRYGIRPKVHANQLNRSGGVQVGVKLGALSVDHLENVGEEEIALLGNSDTIATVLPGAAFFLRLPFPPARRLIEQGAAIAIASDYNPGSAPCGNMNLMVAMSCIQMKMLPEEAVQAATINGAYAMDAQQETGSIEVGKLANLLITKPIKSLAYLPYAFGSDSIEQVILAGKAVR